MSESNSLGVYRRIVLLTEEFSTPFYAKTAMGLLRYRQDDVVGIFDRGNAGKTAQELFGVGGAVPVIGTLDGLKADALFLATALVGGRIPEGWRAILVDALRRGMDLVSGTHQFLDDDIEFRETAESSGAQLIDVRRNNARHTSTGTPLRSRCLRVHTVGQDCTLGKMVVSLEVQRELARRGVDAKFIATGQTGIMISGEGLPVDCVVADFVNGSVEALVRESEHHDVLVIEGQGSISHPSFSAVTLGLLHGCSPQALIYCYEIGRRTVKGLDQVPLLDHRTLIDVYLATASLRQDCRVIGIAMNGRNVSAEQVNAERERMETEFGIPACDVFRHGPDSLADAVLQLQTERDA